ncbi:RNA-directed DNA polymerase-like protein [Gossypium australe]|uniref:RNA-directed DNA polymerase-like protein n=1 Tax=Gossypium australe TaxID=47621 RepID=A0A5B6WFE9_9ROSI|nr:RNA-directed DNA polymerase-like protein [Gossypium australe]
MYIDFTNLNKACPKNSFPLPSINRLIDTSFDNNFMSFMDAFFGYNQISIALKDQEKTTFVTREGATYQRLVNKIFKKIDSVKC